MEPSDAVIPGKILTSVEELADQMLKRRVPKDVSFGYLDLRDSLFGCLLFI